MDCNAIIPQSTSAWCPLKAQLNIHILEQSQLVNQFDEVMMVDLPFHKRQTDNSRLHHFQLDQGQ